MSPRPRDFSSGVFKYKSTAAAEPPTDEDLLRTVRDGLPASAMPYFAGLLSPEELNAVVQEVKSFSKAPRTIAGFGDTALAERTSAGLVPR
jgi:hypothetical protein